jgi:hypothetical protein
MAKSTPNSEIGGGSSASGGRGRLGVSVRSGEVDSGTKRMVKAQNKSAESYKVKDLDAMEANKIKYQQAKDKIKQDLADAKNSGKKTAAAVAIPALVVAEEVGRALGKKQEAKKQGTQAGHAVTDNNNHTRTVK